MKKLLAACVCTGLVFSLSGCSLGLILERFTSTGDSDMREAFPSSADSVSEEPTEPKDRVYMDEISGNLQNFTGNQLILSSDETSYVFNISNTSLECKYGMLAGDEISVIYEGQLVGTDTSTVKTLKVVDQYHKKDTFQEQTAHGRVIALTPNTITLQSKEGITTVYPITGTPQYYQNGIKSGDWVYLHYKGTLPDAPVEGSSTLNASLVKVLSVSDIDPMDIPQPTPTPLPIPTMTPEEAANQEKQFSATVSGVNMNILQIIPSGNDTVLNLDISALPVYFKGGITADSHVNVAYRGELQEGTLDGITVTAVTGEDPDTIDDRHAACTVSGTVIGNTANTVTIQTFDGAMDTFRLEKAKDQSTSGLEYGSDIRITFRPSSSEVSNIYTALKIQDA